MTSKTSTSNEELTEQIETQVEEAQQKEFTYEEKAARFKNWYKDFCYKLDTSRVTKRGLIRILKHVVGHPLEEQDLNGDIEAQIATGANLCNHLKTEMIIDVLRKEGQKIREKQNEEANNSSTNSEQSDTSKRNKEENSSN